MAEVAKEGIFTKGLNALAGRLGYVQKSPEYLPPKPFDITARQGKGPGFQAVSLVTPNMYYGNQNFSNGITKPSRVTFAMLRKIAEYDAVTRICINTIKKEVALSKWKVKARDGVKVTPNLQEKMDYIRDLFFYQNENNETMRLLLDRLIEDLLTIDAGCIEKVKDLEGRIIGLHHVDGATVRPVYNVYGEFNKDYAYVQVINERIKAEFYRDELIYMMQNPTSDVYKFGYGFSPIESILLIVQSSLLADTFNARQFSEDNVPPGVMDLGDMSDEDAHKFVALWNATVINNVHKIKFVWGGNVDQHKYTPFTPNNRDMQYVEYVDWLSRIKLATFGLTGLDANITQDVNRGTAKAQVEISKSRGVLSMKRLIEEYFNREIVMDLAEVDKDYGLLEFEFIDEKSVSDRKVEAEVDTIRLENGLDTIDELRRRDGKEPYDGEETENSPLADDDNEIKQENDSENAPRKTKKSASTVYQKARGKYFQSLY